jgi:predicted GNAT family acetyltransferase
VHGALDDVRTEGWSVVPHCWYVAQFLDEHPEYADLRATA